jgi:hypothetical protein
MHPVPQERQYMGTCWWRLQCKEKMSLTQDFPQMWGLRRCHLHWWNAGLGQSPARCGTGVPLELIWEPKLINEQKKPEPVITTQKFKAYINQRKKSEPVVIRQKVKEIVCSCPWQGFNLVSSWKFLFKWILFKKKKKLLYQRSNGQHLVTESYENLHCLPIWEGIKSTFYKNKLDHGGSPVILATREVEIEKITVWGQPPF